MRKLLALLLCLAMLTSIWAGGGSDSTQNVDPNAEWVPDDTITIIVGMAPGGGIDTMARTIAPAMSEYLGVPVIVENMPGASSGVAADYIAKHDADGYNLFACSSSICVYPSSENSDVTYQDLDMLVMPFTTHNPAVLVNAKSGITNMDEFIEFIKSKPTTASTAGVGSTWHFPAIMLADSVGVGESITYVPYSSGKETTLAVSRGEVDWSTCGIYQESSEAILSGLVTPLAIMSDKSFDLKGYGTVPSVLDSIPELADQIALAGGWRGFAVKKGTTENIEKKLTEALLHAVNSQAFLDLLSNNGVSPDDVLSGAEAQALFEESTKVFSYMLYDLGYTYRNPEDIGVPRP